MMRRLIAPDRVAITGSVIGIISLLFGWLTLKPNRLADGTSLTLWNANGWGVTVIFLLLWLLCLYLSIFGKRKSHFIALGLTLNLILLLIFLLGGSTATGLVEQTSPLARVSLGAGIWTGILGVYMAIFACRQRLGSSPLWQNIIAWSGLVFVIVLLATGWLNDISITREYLDQQVRFRQELTNHIIIFATSVAIGILIGIPLGIWATRNRFAEKPIFFITNILQTVPSLVLFGLLIAVLSALSFTFHWKISGIGVVPAVIALVLYSLLPIVRNTYVSLKEIDPAVIDSGRGMGMKNSQIFWSIEAPLSAPLVLEGVRTASVQAVGNTAVAALIGAGGLGWFIFQGIAQAANDVVVLGALPIIALALIVDTIMRIAVQISTPKGIKTR